MKKIISTLTISLALLAMSFTTQGAIDEVINAINAGNVGELSKFIGENVEITMPNKSDNYSKSQATVILKDFFASNAVKTFEVKHKGDNSAGQFCVGTLQTRQGSYRTTVFMRSQQSGQTVKEIRFQPMN